MSLRWFATAALCVAAMAVPAFAARVADPNSLDEVIKRVQEHQKKTTTLQADFKQEKTLALLSKPEVSSGHFTYQKPNNVLWSYDAPKRVTMLIANGMMTTYYPDLNKAEQIEVKRYQDRIFKYMGASGALDELATYFNFTFSNRADLPAFVLDLDPKTKSIASSPARPNYHSSRHHRYSRVHASGHACECQVTDNRATQITHHSSLITHH